MICASSLNRQECTAMDVYMLVLRFIHVLSGVFWAGSAIFFALLLVPAMGDAAEAGGRVMGALGARKLPTWLGAAGGLTVLSGLLMYFRDTNNFANVGGFISTGPGLMFTIGGLAGLTTII